MRTCADDILDAMLRRADALLYSAKAMGRSRTHDEQEVQLPLQLSSD